jgi:hypothetical protein
MTLATTSPVGRSYWVNATDDGTATSAARRLASEHGHRGADSAPVLWVERIDDDVFEVVIEEVETEVPVEMCFHGQMGFDCACNEARALAEEDDGPSR